MRYTYQPILVNAVPLIINLFQIVNQNLTLEMKKRTIFHLATTLALCLVAVIAEAQTVDDGIMMSKKQWCNGLTYMHSAGMNTGREPRREVIKTWEP